jgi:hypothetical protein
LPKGHQQTKRTGIGFELNPEYIKQTMFRLEEKFDGFDSMDQRMNRIPNDLRDPIVRDEYLSNHMKWFFQNHESSTKLFEKAVEDKYGIKIKSGRDKSSQWIQKSLGQ